MENDPNIARATEVFRNVQTLNETIFRKFLAVAALSTGIDPINPKGRHRFNALSDPDRDGVHVQITSDFKDGKPVKVELKFRPEDKLTVSRGDVKFLKPIADRYGEWIESKDFELSAEFNKGVFRFALVTESDSSYEPGVAGIHFKLPWIKVNRRYKLGFEINPEDPSSFSTNISRQESRQDQRVPLIINSITGVSSLLTMVGYRMSSGLIEFPGFDLMIISGVVAGLTGLCSLINEYEKLNHRDNFSYFLKNDTFLHSSQKWGIEPSTYIQALQIISDLIPDGDVLNALNLSKENTLGDNMRARARRLLLGQGK